MKTFHYQLCEAMDTSSLETVAVYECISSEGATANPLKVGFLLSYADWVTVFFSSAEEVLPETDGAASCK